MLLAVSAVVTTNLYAGNITKCAPTINCKKGDQAVCTSSGMPKEFRQENKLSLKEDTLFTLRQYFAYKGQHVMDCQYFMNWESEPVIVYRNIPGHWVTPSDSRLWDKFGDFAYTCNPSVKDCRINIEF